MLPDSVLSTDVLSGPFIPPRNLPKRPFEVFELGGVAINDGSLGQQVYTWRGTYVGSDFILEVPGIIAPVTIFSDAGVTEFDFTFDQNMQPAMAYMVNGVVCKLRWFDTTIPGFDTITLPAGSYAPRCNLDDKRRAQSTPSDIILTYVRGTSLYFRAQRERFLTEHLLTNTFPADAKTIGQFAMNVRLRMQWQLVPVSVNPNPVLTSIDPADATAGDAGFTMTLNGTGFLPTSLVLWDGVVIPTTYVTAIELTATVSALLIASPGTADVSVVNQLPGGGESSSQLFTINHVVPTIVSLDPASVSLGASGFDLTINGTGFYPDSVARFEGASRATTYVSPTQITAFIPDTDLTVLGFYDITVFNPTPGGGESNAEQLEVSLTAFRFTDGYTPPAGDSIVLQFTE